MLYYVQKLHPIHNLLRDKWRSNLQGIHTYGRIYKLWGSGWYAKYADGQAGMRNETTNTFIIPHHEPKLIIHYIGINNDLLDEQQTEGK